MATQIANLSHMTHSSYPGPSLLKPIWAFCSLLLSFFDTAITAAVCSAQSLREGALETFAFSRPRCVAETSRRNTTRTALKRLDRVKRKTFFFVECGYIMVKYTHWSLVLQNGRLSGLVFKDALGLCAVLSRVHFGVGRSPLVPGAAQHTNRSHRHCVSNTVYSVPLDDVSQRGR